MKLIPLLLAGAVLSPVLSSAVTIYGLTSTNGLISFDSATPGTVTNIGAISQAGIVDIDFYPVNGKLYGATSTGSLYTINTASGAATLAATPSMSVTGVTAIDFNPGADRLRVLAGTSNFRITPDVGTPTPATPGLVTADGMFAAGGANLVSAAYTNPFDGATAFDLYSIDSVSDSLFLHSGGPQFNNAAAVGGALGFNAGLNVGFDIGQNGIAYVTNDQSFYTVNLATGAATAAGTVGGTGLTKIAVAAVPEASTASVLLLTGLCALRRRRA